MWTSDIKTLFLLLLIAELGALLDCIHMASEQITVLPHYNVVYNIYKIYGCISELS